MLDALTSFPSGSYHKERRLGGWFFSRRAEINHEFLDQLVKKKFCLSVLPGA
jgi:hypothetical protein